MCIHRNERGYLYSLWQFLKIPNRIQMDNILIFPNLSLSAVAVKKTSGKNKTDDRRVGWRWRSSISEMTVCWKSLYIKKQKQTALHCCWCLSDSGAAAQYTVQTLCHPFMGHFLFLSRKPSCLSGSWMLVGTPLRPSTISQLSCRRHTVTARLDASCDY